MKLKQLEGYLGEVATFKDPKVQLEQYPTGAHLAARVVYTAATAYGDIEDKAVVDLGCGCGVLSIAAAMMGAASVVGIDIDQDALDIARDNIEEFDVEDTVDLVRASLCTEAANGSSSSSSSSSSSGGGLVLDQLALEGMRGKFDTAILNPPFGTKPGNKGIDVRFLEAACQMTTGTVYSLHKSSTREYLAKKAAAWGLRCEVVAELRFDVPMMYKFHKKRSVDIEVDLLRLSHQ